MEEATQVAVNYFHLSEEKIFLSVLEENENEIKVEALIDINLALEGKKYLESIALLNCRNLRFPKLSANLLL